MSVQLAEILRLPVRERIKFVEDIWDSIAAESEAIAISTEQRSELQRRIESYRSDPSQTIPWESIKAAALAKN